MDGPELPLTHPPPSLGVLDTILLGFLFVCLFTYLWPHQAMCGILVPQPGIKPGSPALGFPGSSAGKESACSAGDPGSIPGSGRSPGAGIGYPLQYSASLVAQTVKNPPVVQQTQVRSLGWEDLLEEGMATHSSILAWKISMDGRARRATVHGVTKSQTQLSD